MVRDHLRGKLAEAFKRQGVEEAVDVERPTNPSFGDYSTNAALKYAKKAGVSPFDLAEKVAADITPDEVIESTSVAKPGFVNVTVKPTAYKEEFNARLQSPITQGKTILLEYGDPNTHKLLHIGHLFSYIYGESLARMYEECGNTVHRVSYQGDVGLHVAKCLYYLTKRFEEFKKKETLEAKIRFLQECYQDGSADYDSDEVAKKAIQEVNTKIYMKDEAIFPIWKESRDLNLEYYKEVEKKLGIDYKRHYFESEVSAIGGQVVKEHLDKYFEKSEGAIVFKGEKYGLHTRVFINKQGHSTYEAKDIGLITLKKNEYTFDLSLVTTASEQSEYWKVIKQASELIYPELVGKIKHIGFGMVNLSTGKMSSRTGHIIDAITLLDVVKKQIKVAFDITDETLADKITLASVKYSFLKSDIYSNISFDLETSISREGNSGPYLLYTYARCGSVIAGQKVTDSLSVVPTTPEEIALMKKVTFFGDVVESSLNVHSPHLIATYLYDLAREFNLFYQKHSILKSEEPVKQARLTLTAAVQSVLKRGLYLLGIDTVEKM